MAHHNSDQPPRSREPEARRVRAREALVDYDRHGDALFSLALLLDRDVDRAAEAVVATLTRADTTASDLCPDAKRQHLAADLWNRCTGAPGRRMPEPAPQPEPNRPSREQDRSGQEQALLGLVLFGGHTHGQAAALIGLPASSAAERLRTLLHRAAERTQPPPGVSSTPR